MTQFKGFDGLSEAQLKLLFSFLLKQDSTGLATDGVLTGLGVAQTTTASASVKVSAGAGVVQDSVLNGVSPLVLDTDLTLDVLTANPMGGVPRNDLVVFDAATVASGSGGVRVVVGTPNASPTDPSTPSTAIPLARLRHAASATTVPAAKIDDLRVYTNLFGSKPGNKRTHWGTYSFTPDASGYATITHNAGFTPSAVVITWQGIALQCLADSFTSTTFRVREIASDGSVGPSSQQFSAFLGE